MGVAPWMVPTKVSFAMHFAQPSKFSSIPTSSSGTTTGGPGGISENYISKVIYQPPANAAGLCWA